MILERREFANSWMSTKIFLVCPILWVSSECMVNAFEADSHHPRSDFGNTGKEKKKRSLTLQGVRNKYKTTGRYTCLPGAIQKVHGRLLLFVLP